MISPGGLDNSNREIKRAISVDIKRPSSNIIIIAWEETMTKHYLKPEPRPVGEARIFGAPSWAVRKFSPVVSQISISALLS